MHGKFRVRLKFLRVRLIEALIAATTYYFYLAAFVYMNRMFHNPYFERPTLLLLRMPLFVQAMLLIPLAFVGSIVLVRGASMKTEHNWKRGVIQLLIVGTGVSILVSPFLLKVTPDTELQGNYDPAPAEYRLRNERQMRL